MTPGRRRIAARVLVVVASFVLLLAFVAAYVKGAAIDSDQFANRATAALENEDVRNLLAEKVTDDLVLKKDEDLLAARPLIESAASTVMGSRPFTELFRAAVADVHRALFDRSRSTVTLTIADAGTVVADALQQVNPKLAKELDATKRVDVITSDIGSLTSKLADAGDNFNELAEFLAMLAVLLIAAAIWISDDRRRTVVGLGIGLTIAGASVVLGLDIAKPIAVHQVSGTQNQAAAGAVWDAFLHDLHTAGWFVAGFGTLIAAAADSLLRPIDLGQPVRWLAERLSAEPERPALRAARGAALLIAGLFVVVNTQAVIAFIVTLGGIYLIYAGITMLLRVIYRPEMAQARAAGEDEPRRHRIGRLALPAVGVLVILAVTGTFFASGGATTAAPSLGGCEGSLELCDRPFNQVALAATHNAMSVPLPGWYSAEQDAPIPTQLDDGIRGLLIDTHYGDLLPDGKVRTELGSSSMVQAAKDEGLSKDALRAAERIRNRLGFSGEGERGMYLCHTFCELGATSLAEVLGQLRDFLVANPDEIVVVVNQDEVTPQDFVGAVRDAGLEEMAYRGPFSGTWPTLREMIDSNQRVIFMAEEHGGAAPWYQPVYESITQETPYTFRSADLLTKRSDLAASCEPNRGPSDAPLFLLNHWVSTDPIPRPSDAEKVNARGALLRRAKTCERIRGQMPNLVAVNFYRRGDVFGVVDELNGLGDSGD